MKSHMRIEGRAELIDALGTAAALEHGVVCNYLYAAFSLKTHVDEGNVTPAQLERTRSWRRAILQVAREEMEHLGLVCNMLTAIGAMPWFEPPTLELEPFGEGALQTFVRIEAEHGEVKGGDTIGAKYAAIREGFEAVSKKNELLFVGPAEYQVDNEAIDLPPGWYDVDLRKVTDLSSALSALDRIVESSHGESEGPSHVERFESILAEFRAERRSDPSFRPARPVARNPTLLGGASRSVANQDRKRGARGDRSPIRSDAARAVATLFNATYEVMLVMLVRLYAPGDESASKREALQKIAFFPLMTMVLRPLGEILTRIPIEDDSPYRAGPTFECRRALTLPPHSSSAMTTIHERLRNLKASSSRIAGSDILPGLDAALAERLRFVHESLERIEMNFARSVDADSERAQFLLTKLVHSRNDPA